MVHSLIVTRCKSACLFSQKKQLIKEKKVDLTEWLRVDRSLILQHVHSKGIITDGEYSGFKTIKNPDESNGELIDKVYDKGEETCAKFLLELEDDRIKKTYPDLAKWIASQAGKLLYFMNFLCAAATWTVLRGRMQSYNQSATYILNIALFSDCEQTSLVAFFNAVHECVKEFVEIKDLTIVSMLT